LLPEARGGNQGQMSLEREKEWGGREGFSRGRAPAAVCVVGLEYKGREAPYSNPDFPLFGLASLTLSPARVTLQASDEAFGQRAGSRA